MQPMRKAAFDVPMRLASTEQQEDQASLPMFSVQRESGELGPRAQFERSLADYITAGDSEDRCDICASNRDVAQLIGVMEGPEGITDGVATLFFICATCCARAIEVTTGFKATKSLDSWYRVRAYHAKHKGGGTITGLGLEEPPE